MKDCVCGHPYTDHFSAARYVDMQGMCNGKDCRCVMYKTEGTIRTIDDVPILGRRDNEV